MQSYQRAKLQAELSWGSKRTCTQHAGLQPADAWFLSCPHRREVPQEQLLLVIRSFGGIAAWAGEGSPLDEADDSITHQVMALLLLEAPSAACQCRVRGATGHACWRTATSSRSDMCTSCRAGSGQAGAGAPLPVTPVRAAAVGL